MGILSNTVSICHFRVMGELVQGDNRHFYDFAHELLARHAFTPIDDSTEELSIGWVHLDDPKMHLFASASDCWRDNFLIFSLRRDQRKVPAALLKEHFEKACEQFKEDNGVKFVPKQRKEELKELVRGRLLAKTLPDPKIYDVVWDTERNMVTFTTFSAKLVETFEETFKKTFEGLRLVAFHPYERAMSVIPAGDQPLLARANKASGNSALELIKENQWLGADFMLWLLYRTLNSDSEYRVNYGDEPFIAFINDKVVLVGAGDGGATQMITVNGPQDRFSEIKSALQGNKRPAEATIHLNASDEKWCLTLKGELFHFASFASPAVKLEKDSTTDEQMEREAVFFERMLLIDKGLQLFDSLFAAFLQVRLGPDWYHTEPAIMEWMQEG